MTGWWEDDLRHGKFTDLYPNGASVERFWYKGDDVTGQVKKCRTATTVTDTYKGFVAILNGLVAAANGENALEGAARGYDLAEEQIGPKAVDLTCAQLLRVLE